MLSCQISIKGLFQRASLSIFRKSLQSFRVSMWSIVYRIPNFQKEPSLRCLFGGSSDQSLHTSKRASKWRLCSFAWSGYLACFGFARVHPPLRLSRFRWLPLGVPWVVRFSLASPWVWLGLFVFPLFLPPVVSGLLWGCLCLVGAGRLGPPDAMEWLVVGAACCWRGRFWLLALLLLPPQLLCAVQLGAVQIKVHTHQKEPVAWFL